MVHVYEAIQETVARLVAAWNEGDAKAFASLFTAEADYITGRGRWLKGREAIEEEFSVSDAKASVVRINNAQIRLLNTDVALVHHTWEMAGQATEGSPVRRGIITQVLIRQDQRWLIAALQNTDVEPLR